MRLLAAVFAMGAVALSLNAATAGIPPSVLNGIQSSVKGSQEKLESLEQSLLESSKGPASTEALDVYLTGADAEIDNTIGSVASGLAPYTFGLSQVIANWLLTDFVKTVVSGACSVYTKLGDSPDPDLLLGSLLTYAADADTLGAMANKSQINTSDLNQAVTRLSQVVMEQAMQSCPYVEGLEYGSPNVTIQDVQRHCVPGRSAPKQGVKLKVWGIM